MAVILEIVSAALPVLVSVTVCSALEVPSDWLPNIRLVELNAKPTVESGVSAVLPPPPQDEDNKAITKKPVAKISLDSYDKNT